MRPTQHPYCYPGTDVLRNKLDIRNKAFLEMYERLQSANRLESLPRSIPITPAGFRELHRWLLQDVYDWAGEYRLVQTGRSGPFCRPEFIAVETNKRFAAVHAEDDLRSLYVDLFAARAAEHVNELNAIHPFLDGNGRAIRALLEILAQRAGHEIDLALVSPDAWNEASKRGYHTQDHVPMARVIAGLLKRPMV